MARLYSHGNTSNQARLVFCMQAGFLISAVAGMSGVDGLSLLLSCAGGQQRQILCGILLKESSSVMKIFGIAGFKNVGKTTLVVDLIKEFRSRGVRVATVKHAHHDFDIDHPGKDSYQHREAGAEEVFVVSARRWAHIRELEQSAEPELSEVLHRLGDVDLVLIEGYKHGRHPRLELRRDGVEPPELLAGQDQGVCAVVCDADVDTAGLPLLARADVAGIANFVWEHALPFSS
jgi:molybdopterin-guanine dinucleotide biosynthesis protein B